MTNLAPKKILVIGNGGREHAVCEAFKKSSKSSQIFVINGNFGTREIAKNIDFIKPNQVDLIVKFCQDQAIDFVFVGPEQPLVEGLVDILEQNKIRVFGPSKKASALEGSKIFMKEIAQQNNVPTAKYGTFESSDHALNFINKIGLPCVIKADGLASGKGVIIAHSNDEAMHAINECFSGKFGEAGKKIIIEEFLRGFEASYFVICDGKNFIPLGFAHDHKKVGEGETGLNTGGMGTFAPSPFIDQKLEQKIIETVIKPTLEGMNKINAPFCGILFAGLMIDNENPKLLEFNVRFGDPETQVILPRIKSDFIDLIEHAIDKKINDYKIEFYPNKKLVCVVMCSRGYPENYIKNSEIKNLKNVEALIKNTPKYAGVKILHAGTSVLENKVIATGGRVLNIVAEADSFDEARQKAYEVVDLIDWKEGFVRRDIALKALKG